MEQVTVISASRVHRVLGAKSGTSMWRRHSPIETVVLDHRPVAFLRVVNAVIATGNRMTIISTVALALVEVFYRVAC